MLNDHQRLDGHERFRELGALANAGALSPNESSELDRHLLACEECREVCAQYRLLSIVGMSWLASNYAQSEKREDWDDLEAREKLMARIDGVERPAHDRLGNPPAGIRPNLSAFRSNQSIAGAVAACLGVAIVFGAYFLGSKTRGERSISLSLPDSAQQSMQLAAEKRSSDELVEAQATKISQIQLQNTKQAQEVDRLRAALRALEDHSHELEEAGGKTEAQLRAVSEERDALTAQLQQAEQSYQSVKSELASLHAENDRELLHSASLQSKIDELMAVNRDQERRLGNDEQFLASDRDIRELMGARKLYIADVFDVDSGSRTRKPFGRVFYTQNKSLIFYAFDLDHQAGVKNASIFQVWGQKDAELSEKARPMNLGILYMDSESNRRWVLRLDDSKQLADIDAVFVTVEPHAGSPKPTGKPFLYALLRKEVNHP
jgi:anti-sigma-K factor RskA